MIRILCAFMLASLLLVVPRGGSSEADDSPVHAVQVSGHDVAMYPAFSPTTQRYGVTTGSATGGTLTVQASTSDPDGEVLVDGVRTVGSRRLTGLHAGDETSIIIRDSAGTEVHSLVYLPAGFPHLSTVVNSPSTSNGQVLLTLSPLNVPGSSFDVAVDRNGVPSYLRTLATGTSSFDLKAAPGGHYSVIRTPTSDPGRTGGQVVELDAQFAPVRTLSTVGLHNTDIHDAILRPDGSRILLAYEPNAVTGRDDAVIQEVDAAGHEVYTWRSSEHLDPDAETTNTAGSVDYAHINSIQEMADGDILASFRHFSSVYKIAWSTRGNLQRGDIVWRLGGRHSDFTFPGDPDHGPCAQHSASELANGHVLVFDNGSAGLGTNPSYCVDPADPTGPTIDRPRTRVAEYALDSQAGTATLVWSYSQPPTFAYFAGSARRLSGGNTLIDWAADTHALATEVSPAGQVLWELKNDDSYFSYRAAKAVVPDAIKPEIAVTRPAPGATYVRGQVATAAYACTDRGGSDLQTCTGAPTPLDTGSVGRHTYAVTATDGAGNTTTLTRTYSIVPPFSRPDEIIRGGGSGWVGNNVYGSPAPQRVTQQLGHRGARATSIVRVQNEGNRADTVVLRGTKGTRDFAVHYFAGGGDVTGRVRNGKLQLALARGRSADVRVVVTRLRPARVHDSIRVLLTARSAINPRRYDTVATRVRATR